jgi:hypothetical protein
MRWLFLIALFIQLNHSWSQHFVYIQTGRPYTLARNNAFKTIGKDVNLTFTYDGGDVYNEQIHGSIEQYNDSIIKVVQAFYPDFTLDQLFQLVQDEETKQDKIGELVRATQGYKGWKHPQQSSSQLLYNRNKNGRSYTVFRIYQATSNGGNNWLVAQAFVYSLKNNRVREIQVKSTKLPFTFPINGIF